MSHELDHEKFIEFKAEVKSDVKYIRVDINSLQIMVGELTRKIHNQCTEIAVLKTKVAMYAAASGAIVSLIVSIAIMVLNALIKG